MRDEVFIVAGHQHPIRARQRRYYDDPALVRLLPDPNGPDPLIDLHRAVALPVPMVEPTLEVVAPEDDDIAPPSSTREGDTMSMPSTGVGGHGAVLPNRAETLPIHAPARNEELTEAEIALLAAMVAAPGASSATLATSLRVAASTVRKRQGAVRTKLGGMDGDLVRLAQERGALPLVTMVAEDTGASSVEDV